MRNTVTVMGLVAAITAAGFHAAFGQRGGPPAEGAQERVEERLPGAPQETRPQTDRERSAEERPEMPDQREVERAARDAAAERRESAQERGAGAAASARGPAAAGERGQAQREAALERQSAQFQEIHERRMAQLQRLRELAVDNEREDMIDRIDGLIDRERERHSRQTARIEGRGARPE